MHTLGLLHSKCIFVRNLGGARLHLCDTLSVITEFKVKLTEESANRIRSIYYDNSYVKNVNSVVSNTFFFSFAMLHYCCSYWKLIIFSLNFAEVKNLVSVHDQTENIEIVHGNPQLWSNAGHQHNSICLVKSRLQLSIGTTIIFFCGVATPTICLTTFPLMKVKARHSWCSGMDACYVHRLGTDPAGFDPSQALSWGGWRLRGIAAVCAQVLLLPNQALVFN